jgi:hypothetical protein
LGACRRGVVLSEGGGDQGGADASSVRRRLKVDYGDGVDGAPTASSAPRWSLSKPHLREASMGKSIKTLSSVTVVGLDFASGGREMAWQSNGVLEA